MRHESAQSDVAVLSGELSGMGVAIPDVKRGKKLLIQNRPVLGGFS